VVYDDVPGNEEPRGAVVVGVQPIVTK